MRVNVEGRALKPRIAVLGAGITGLSAAFWITESLPEAEVVLYETKDRPGGLIGTFSVGGNLLETGPLAFPAGAPATGELLRKAGLASICTPCSGKGDLGLWDGDRLLPFPRSPQAFLRSGLLSPRGYLRLMSEPFRPRGRAGEEETVLEFFRRRTGVEFLECFMEPFAAGILSGDPATMSMPANLPALHAMERNSGSLAAGFWKKIFTARKPSPSRQTLPAGLVTTPTGSQGIIEGLSALLRRRGVELKLSHRISSISCNGHFSIGWESGGEGGNAEFDAVISCLPSHALAAVAVDWPGEIRDILSGIPHAPLELAHLGYRKRDMQGRFAGEGFLMQCKAGDGVLSVFFSSRMSPDRCGEDSELVRVMLGGARWPELSTLDDASIHCLASRTIRKILGLTCDPRAFPRIRHDHGLPQLVIGHARGVLRLRGWLQAGLPGFFLAGTSFQGAGIENGIASGKRAVAEAADYLNKSASTLAA